MKISKKRLANKVRKLEVQNYDMRQKIKKMDKALTYLDELTTELNHALPDPEYDAKCEAVADIEASLDRHRERLGLNKPKPKQLDQSVFDGQDEKWRFAAVDADGKAHRCNLHVKPHHERGEFWRGCTFPPLEFELIGEGYDTSNWQNSLIEREPKLKKLDRSVFDGVFNWVKSAAINPNGAAYFYSVGENGFYDINNERGFQITGMDKCQCIGLGYDTTDWRNSLIERESKELTEVDLSSELTGSELCKAMLERGDKFVMCFVSGMSDAKADSIPKAITSFNSLTRKFRANHDIWRYAVPINNQGEPLTAKEVGL